MKLLSIIKKSFREQIRSFWILLLTISMAPFFVCVYYLIIESYVPHYDIYMINNDMGIELNAINYNFGDVLSEESKKTDKKDYDLPISIRLINDKEKAIQKLKYRKADVLIIIPQNFSMRISQIMSGELEESLTFEFIGDLTNIEYMLSAIYANEILSNYIYEISGQKKPISIKETSLGSSGEIDDFDLTMPGILILSIIMLMFTATIALVTEVENKTIIRLRLSKISTIEFIAGISVSQVIIGIVSILLTLAVAVILGFDYYGSIWIIILIAVLTSISIVFFSLILAAITKTVNEVLIVGNFPLFLFMFFTGAAFPMQANALFSISDYPVSLQSLMSPNHAISALNKILIMNMSFKDILPEILALITISLIYFIIGAWAFKKRHMRIE